MTLRSSLVPRRSSPISLFLVLALCSACEEGPGAASPGGGSHPLIGNPAPAFDLPAQSGGKRASLEKAAGKVAIVDFWATWCAPCRASFPKYQALSEKYEDSLVVMGISEDDEADGIADFAKETGATFTLAWDTDKSVAGSYHPDSMPTSFIIDKNGLVRFVHNGFREGDEKEIESQIKKLSE
jgi:peroxiredoxin